MGSARTLSWWAVVVVAPLASGCIVRTTEPWVEYTAPEPIVVAEPPPPARAEVPAPQPMSDGVWLEGHWEWRSGRYLWVEGRWERSRHGYAWVAPRYEQSANGWVYVRGHWRPATGAVAPRGTVRRAVPAHPRRARPPRRAAPRPPARHHR